MKNKGIILTAVLLLAVLLFFLKEKNERDKEENPTGTPVPTQKAGQNWLPLVSGMKMTILKLK